MPDIASGAHRGGDTARHLLVDRELKRWCGSSRDPAAGPIPRNGYRWQLSLSHLADVRQQWRGTSYTFRHTHGVTPAGHAPACPEKLRAPYIQLGGKSGFSAQQPLHLSGGPKGFSLPIENGRCFLQFLHMYRYRLDKTSPGISFHRSPTTARRCFTLLDPGSALRS